MDIKDAKHFKGHLKEAIRQLSLSLGVAEKVSTPEDFATIRKSVADIIARVDTLLYDAVDSVHPELNDFRESDKT